MAANPMFEEIVYRGYGPHSRKGGGFSTLGVKSEEALAAALKDGWYLTLDEAIAAKDGVKAEQPAAAPATPAAPEPQDNAPPTRAELEQKAKELGLKVHPKISDANLLKKINEHI